MHEKFDDVSRAVSYVASGIRSDFPKGQFEVVAERRGNTMSFSCAPSEITRILLEVTKRFPLATVYYTAEDPQGHIAEIHCHCRGEKAPSCCRYNHHRARVLVHLVNSPAPSTETETGGALTSA